MDSTSGSILFRDETKCHESNNMVRTSIPTLSMIADMILEQQLLTSQIQRNILSVPHTNVSRMFRVIKNAAMANLGQTKVGQTNFGQDQVWPDKMACALAVPRIVAFSAPTKRPGPPQPGPPQPPPRPHSGKSYCASEMAPLSHSRIFAGSRAGHSNLKKSIKSEKSNQIVITYKHNCENYNYNCNFHFKIIIIFIIFTITTHPHAHNPHLHTRSPHPHTQPTPTHATHTPTHTSHTQPRHPRIILIFLIV